jgi:hypothetical protein
MCSDDESDEETFCTVRPYSWCTGAQIVTYAKGTVPDALAAVIHVGEKHNLSDIKSDSQILSDSSQYQKAKGGRVVNRVRSHTSRLFTVIGVPAMSAWRRLALRSLNLSYMQCRFASATIIGFLPHLTALTSLDLA